MTLTIVTYALVATNLALCIYHGRCAARYRRMLNGSRPTAGDSDDTDLTAINSPVGGTIYFPRGTFTLSSSTGPLGALTTGESPGLTETEADVPVLAYKNARLSWRPPGRFSLVSNATSNPLEADADATCLNGSDHVAPDVGCTCGFYAVRDETELSDSYGMVRLEVELSGRVIVHEKGYRAQHQRVLRATLPGCYYCGDDPTIVDVGQPEYQSSGMFITTSFGTNVVANTPSGTVRPLCDAHSAEAKISVPMAKVVAQLGVPLQ